MDLHILLTTIKQDKTHVQVKSHINEWHWEIQILPLNSIFHGTTSKCF